MITHEERVSRAARRVIRLEDGAVVRDEVVAPATAAQKEST
jgi:ABC-type lipoprotein export system ATPase subunit